MESLNYHETFSFVAKMVTVLRTLLFVGASRNWGIRQMDVHNAFLHGYLIEKLYMRLSPTFLKDVIDKHLSFKKISVYS